MKPAFSFLVVHGDGSRVMRFRLPRWLVYVTLATLSASLAAAAGLSSRYVALARESSEVASLRRRVDAQRSLIGAFQERASAIREEITTWKALHASMWEALGPDAASREPSPGIGGVAAPSADLPAGRSRPLEDLDHLVSTVAEEGPRLRELEDVIVRTGKILSALPLRWPVVGPVNSEFGKRQSPWTGRLEEHRGIDIGARAGTPVESPAAGKIVVASAQGGYGKHVKVDHGNGVRSLYGHLSELDVRVGQEVAKGDVIGRVGSTGRSTGPHLHYEIRVDGKRVNPRRFLWER